jgi:hypothetical protein
VRHSQRKYEYEEHKEKPCVGIFLFDKPSSLIRDLELVKDILVKDAQYFTDRINSFDGKLDPPIQQQFACA